MEWPVFPTHPEWWRRVSTWLRSSYVMLQLGARNCQTPAIRIRFGSGGLGDLQRYCLVYADQNGMFWGCKVHRRKKQTWAPKGSWMIPTWATSRSTFHSQELWKWRLVRPFGLHWRSARAWVSMALAPKTLIEGSLEVKLPTIWTDGIAEGGRVREEKSRREKIREEKEWGERRCRCAKTKESRETLCFSNDLWLRRVEKYAR